MQRTIDAWGDAFLNRVFTPDELAYARARKNTTHHIAARFAVKEAVAKAMATGWSGDFRWKNIEVVNDSSGKPSVRLHGRARNILEGNSVFISISHSESVVVAMAIIEATKS